jgi:hypothetical protein
MYGLCKMSYQANNSKNDVNSFKAFGLLREDMLDGPCYFEKGDKSILYFENMENGRPQGLGATMKYVPKD